MLIKLLILPFIFIISGFSEFGEYTSDNEETPNVNIVDENWATQLEKEIEAKQEIKKEKTFEDYAIEDNNCGGENRKFRVGVISKNPPFSWEKEVVTYIFEHKIINYENEGLLKGFLKEMFESFGSPKYEIISFETVKDLEKALQRGKVDIGLGLPYNPDPLLGIDYVFPSYFQNPIIAVFKDKEQAEKIKHFSDLKKLRGISLSREEGLDDMIESFQASEKEISIVTPDITREEMYDYLLYNRVTYILTSFYSALAYQKEYELEEDVYFSEPVRVQQQFIGFSKNSECRPYKKYFEEFVSKNVYEKLEKLYYEYLDLWMEQNKEVIPYKDRQKVKEKIKVRTIIYENEKNEKNTVPFLE